MDISEAKRLEREGKLTDAEQACRRGLDAAPDDPGAVHLLGTVLHRLGKNDEALPLLERAASVSPENFAYRSNLAAVLGRLGRPEDALPHLQEAVRLRPSSPEAHNNLAAALEQLGRLRESAEELRKALERRRDYPEAWYNLGGALRKAGRVVPAASAYQEAVRYKADYFEALGNLPQLVSELGDAEEAIAWCRRIVELRPELPSPRSALLYTLHYSPRYDAERVYQEHREWGRLFCDPLREKIRPHENDRNADRKLRVGYVSPDLREHTVTKFITAALEHHDRESFEPFCYSDAEKPDAVTQRCKNAVEHWHDTRGVHDDRLEQMIRQDKIDILVDLRGHAADNRLTLFARKPAPVQVNMVGYFNTTGLSAMDYRITDALQDPPGASEHLHTENLVRLPHSCWCYTADDDAPDVSETPALKNGFITFGSLNKIVKVSEPCARLWAKVLEEVPKSRLLVSVAGADAAEPVGKRLSSFGLPADRVDILGKTGTSTQYLERYHQIDIALDTFPFNGITTTCEGLWMGVSCVSLSGGTSVSRAGRSILHAGNLPQLATDTPEQFLHVATQLAKDPPRIRDLRLTMRERLLTSPLMDHRRFARDLEAAYREMWRAWCELA